MSRWGLCPVLCSCLEFLQKDAMVYTFIPNCWIFTFACSALLLRARVQSPSSSSPLSLLIPSRGTTRLLQQSPLAAITLPNKQLKTSWLKTTAIYSLSPISSAVGQCCGCGPSSADDAVPTSGSQVGWQVIPLRFVLGLPLADRAWEGPHHS